MVVFAALIALGCDGEQDTGTKEEETHEVEVLVGVSAPVMQVELAGVGLHQVSHREDGTLFGTFSLFGFLAPRSLARPAVEGEWCLSEFPWGVVVGEVDVGPLLELQVGGDTLTLARDLDWEEGETWYYRDREGPAVPGTTPGSDVSLAGVSTGLVLPGPPELDRAEETWEAFLDSGVLDLSWSPTGSDALWISVLSSEGGETNIACELEDDGRAVVDTGLVASRESLVHLALAGRDHAIVDLPDIGPVGVEVYADRQWAQGY